MNPPLLWAAIRPWTCLPGMRGAGGWGCHGGAVTTNNPPELLDVESDLGERYPLQVGY